VTEEIAATPGWVEQTLDTIFAGLPSDTRAAREAYAACLASRKSPGAPSDLLGAEFEPCRRALRQTLLRAGMHSAAVDRLDARLEALEAEIDTGS